MKGLAYRIIRGATPRRPAPHDFMVAVGDHFWHPGKVPYAKGGESVVVIDVAAPVKRRSALSYFQKQLPPRETVAASLFRGMSCVG